MQEPLGDQQTGHRGQDRVLLQAVLQSGEATPRPGAERRCPVLPDLGLFTRERPSAAGHLPTEMLDVWNIMFWFVLPSDQFGRVLSCPKSNHAAGSVFSDTKSRLYNVHSYVHTS